MMGAVQTALDHQARNDRSAPKRQAAASSGVASRVKARAGLGLKVGHRSEWAFFLA